MEKKLNKTKMIKDPRYKTKNKKGNNVFCLCFLLNLKHHYLYGTYCH